MPELIEIEGGEVLANLEDRTITGLLVPYNEVGRTNVGMFEVQAGVLQIPTDPEVVSLNIDHDRYQPVGRATRLWEEPAGIMASFKIAKTEAGDAALKDALDPKGKRRKLSGEFRTGIKAGKAVNGGPVAAGALVEAGAFPSAMVLAADTEYHNESEYTDEQGVTWRRVEDSETTTEQTDSGSKSTTVTTVTEETTEEEQEGTDVPENETEAVQATVALAPTPAGQTKPRVNKQQILAAIATLRRNPLDNSSREVLAALNDITISGDGALPADGVVQPTWMGLIDLGVPYVREFIDLCKHGTEISALGKKGFKFFRGTAETPGWNDGSWAGNKTEINSGKGHTTVHESTLDKYARGADIGREFRDLPGGAEVIEAYLSELDIDYHMWSDELARQKIVYTAGVPAAPETYPGVDGHDYAGSMGQLIQGILAVRRRKADGRRDVPSFAIANEVAYEELLYTPKDLVPEFVTFVVNDDGTATVTGRNGGKVLVRQGETGISDTSSIVVGADYAIEFDELPGGPLHVNALDIAKGGFDEAVHGYLQTFIRRPEALVHVGTAPARANTTAYAEGDLIKASSIVYRVVVAGTSGASAPSAPAVGATVEDGTATLLRLV